MTVVIVVVVVAAVVVVVAVYFRTSRTDMHALDNKICAKVIDLSRGASPIAKHQKVDTNAGSECN